MKLLQSSPVRKEIPPRNETSFDKWARESGVYYHMSPRDGKWTTERALQECWMAAQKAKKCG